MQEERQPEEHQIAYQLDKAVRAAEEKQVRIGGGDSA